MTRMITDQLRNKNFAIKNLNVLMHRLKKQVFESYFIGFEKIYENFSLV